MRLIADVYTFNIGGYDEALEFAETHFGKRSLRWQAYRLMQNFGSYYFGFKSETDMIYFVTGFELW
jgi:hypothetical protein